MSAQRTVSVVSLAALAALAAFSAHGWGCASAKKDGTPAAGDTLPPQYTQKLSGTALEFEMVLIPGGEGVAPFYMSRTEIPWEVLDVYVYQLDTPASNADAVTRPTKPYISMDRGFGHAGWPAISVSANNANHFCEWLSAKTGRTYRLPTPEQWQRAAAVAAIPADAVTEYAWTSENADVATHKLGTRKRDAAGLQDLYGNAAEWVVDARGNAFIAGGSYRSSAAEIDPKRMIPATPNWNASDPQFPKSVWWLADGGFIGVRIAAPAQ